MNNRILIADDHLVVSIGIVSILRSAYPNMVIDIAKSYPEAKNCLLAHKYDVIMLDIHMPGTQYTQMIPEIKELQNDIKILIFSSFDQNIALQYIRKGAEGYLNKQCSEDDVKNAINTILETGFYYPPELIPIIMKGTKETTEVKNLTTREFEVFELLAKGNGNLEISSYLNVQVSTVSTFKKRIFEKLKITNIAELIEIYKCLH
ncbi:two component transcriptional regulator, LuxR family [Chryseobacterium wanjuense]|jgi:DNA-binding NarL/FixJ family response regulator|uniref:Two component transcriptional regulator, LuxR family n=1 Tax=Chryseobacterium wanjuense TaxID=356305 RepID=A0A1I0S0A2_9FLAO|nr:response regulator transcription factor [Chryseobacterium wanjuense]SEW47534.1 two component transcriptional regulator, LuxR family [Chryseobacterium wanjuense]